MKSKINKDVLLKDFWRNNERFADLFNTILFQGKKIVDPANLYEMDTDVSGNIEVKGYNKTISRTRDVIKKTANGVDFIVCGIENQDRIHYAMPLRNMMYDSLGYLKEHREISRNHKIKREEKTREEFLSGMKREDRLNPIITIVIYYNEKEWDGPYSLSDMMIELQPEVKDVFSDYKMNLLQISKSGEYVFSNDDVQTVFQISRQIYEEDFDGIQQAYKDRDIKAELALVIGSITDSNYIVEQASDGREVMNMCTALENLRRQGVEEGLEIGREEWLKQGIEQGNKIGKLEIAKVMMTRGISVDTVVDITGFTIGEIEEFMSREE